MKKINLLLVLLSVYTCAYSQQLHSPSEILKMLNDSKLAYEIKIIDKVIEGTDYSDKLNYHDCYRIATDSGLYTYKINPSDKAKAIFDKAEHFFQSKNTDSALIYYQLSIAADTTLYTAMTYIGQIYDKKGDSENAIIWYKKTIDKNYIDYMAHWFLADAYLKSNDLKNAVDEIVIAQILNRNNPWIKKSMDNIFEKAKRNKEDWSFNPQIQLSKTSDHSITVAMNEKWIGYAMAKALWTYESGYKESMGVTQDHYSTIEDKECLLALLISLENSKPKIKKDPQLRILKAAAESRHLDDYILYEIVLHQTPFVAYQFPKQTILEIKDYVLNVRNTK